MPACTQGALVVFFVVFILLWQYPVADHLGLRPSPSDLLNKVAVSLRGCFEDGGAAWVHCSAAVFRAEIGRCKGALWDLWSSLTSIMLSPLWFVEGAGIAAREYVSEETIDWALYALPIAAIFVIGRGILKDSRAVVQPTDAAPPKQNPKTEQSKRPAKSG